MDSLKTALVIGAGLAGLEAALKIGQAGHKVILVEKESALGGTAAKLFSSFPRWENPADLLEYKIKQINECSLITVMTDTIVTSALKQDKSYVVELQRKNITAAFEVHGVVIATGFELFDASVYGEYGYGSFDNVLDSLQFEDKLRDWAQNKENAAAPKSVAFFKCVGSRDRSKGYPYCSKVCCMYTAKQAGLVKDLFPETKCYVFYMDYRAAGKEYEEFTRSVIEQKHVRYVRGRTSKVLPENGRLLIRAEDTLMGVPIEVTADVIVLASAIVPSSGTREMARLFNAKTDQFGFIDHEDFNPVKTGDRVFYAGACGFAVENLGAMHQGAAAAADVISLFNQVY